MVVSISTDQSMIKLKRFLKSHQADYTVLQDSSGRAKAAYEISAFPTAYLIDSKGIVRHKFLGFKDWGSHGARSILDSLIADDPNS